MQKKFLIFMVVIFFAGLLVWAENLGMLNNAFQVIKISTAPAELFFSNSSSQASGFFSGIFQLGKLQSDNAGLKDNVNQLQAEVAQLSQDKKENDRLKALLGFTTTHDFSYLGVNVVTYDPSNIRGNLTIDKGSKSGLSVGMAVISDGFLIGRIASVDGSSAQVRLITDPESAIPAILQNSSTSGIATGQIGYGLTLSKIPQGSTINNGDTVVTSGLGGDLPNGLIIGSVQNIQKENNSLFETADVRPAANLDGLSRLIVIKGK